MISSKSSAQWIKTKNVQPTLAMITKISTQRDAQEAPLSSLKNNRDGNTLVKGIAKTLAATAATTWTFSDSRKAVATMTTTISARNAVPRGSCKIASIHVHDCR